MNRKLHRALTLSAFVALLGASVCPAQAPAQQLKATRLTSAEEAGWELGFSDRFERAELGADWEVLAGTWKIEDGALQGSGVMVSSRSFPARDKTGLVYAGGFALGYIRMEFAFTALAEDATAPLGSAPEWNAMGSGCFINALWEDGVEKSRIEPGYTFQLVGRQGQDLTIVKRGGQVVAAADRPDPILPQGKRHEVVVENDEGHLRLFVDENLVLEHKESFSIMGSGYDKVGFCFGGLSRIDDLKVYYKRLPGGMDRDEML